MLQAVQASSRISIILKQGNLIEPKAIKAETSLLLLPTIVPQL